MRPLRVALETQFAYGTGTGLGTYARSVADVLRERSDIELAEFAQPSLDVWRFDRRIYWDQIAAPLLARGTKADVIHFTGGTLSVIPPHPCVLTLHDLAWLSGAVHGRFYSRAYFAGLQRMLAGRADRIVADTDAARSEIVARLRLNVEKIAVAGAGVDNSWFSLKRSPAEPPFVLAVGTVEVRKNLETAIRAVANSKTGSRLISVGAPTGYARNVQRLVRELGLESKVELRGFVDDGELRELYATASALIFPSTYEGFGLPPLQALAARLPVIASDIPVLREVLGDCAIFAQPRSAEEFAAGIERVIDDAMLIRAMVERGQMRARNFTWRSVAQRLIDIYHSVA